ncbi:MAG: AAA family ATPase [Chloroflexi bacterium]|nr:AAA family ATPase [Chloroflexota bacterium]
MPTQTKSRRRTAMASRFVGRENEQNLFRDALASADLPFQILYIYGPGGVGKTSLLNQFARIGEQMQSPVFHLDSRNLDPSPSAFIAALKGAIGNDSEKPLEKMAEPGGHPALLIDTYEVLNPLDRWLRDYFWANLPENALVVLAGRNPPSLEWKADPGWEIFFRTIALRNLSPIESRAYLDKRGVPRGQHPAVLQFTHGFPLALSLVAELFAQRAGFRFQPEAAPDVVRAMLERFVQKIPAPLERAALETCALVRYTTEGLLAQIVQVPDARDLFEWLRRVSFIESGRLGLFPHDVAREALAADLRWRNPDWYSELHRRARAYYAQRLPETHGAEQHRVLFDYIFLHRDNPIVRPYFEWQESGNILNDAPREADWAQMEAMIREFEGAESASIARHWFARQPQGAIVYRDVAGDEKAGLAGLMFVVELHKATTQDFAIDPAARHAWKYLETHAPLRQGEGALLFRFWMARDSYQGVSLAQSHLFVNMGQFYLTTPGIAFTFLPCADPDFWAPVFIYADTPRLPEADFETDAHRYGMHGHDWRTTPPATWLALMAEREIAFFPDAAKPPPARETLVVLSEPEFASAVRAALDHYAEPEKLRENPLLRSRLIVSKSDGDAAADRIARLTNLIRQTVEGLQATPRQSKLYRALLHTFITPAPTQEQSAERADVPFSTYRRHLRAGIDHVVQVLWQSEIGK